VKLTGVIPSVVSFHNLTIAPSSSSMVINHSAVGALSLDNVTLGGASTFLLQTHHPAAVTYILNTTITFKGSSNYALWAAEGKIFLEAAAVVWSGSPSFHSPVISTGGEVQVARVTFSGAVTVTGSRSIATDLGKIRLTGTQFPGPTAITSNGGQYIYIP
jgi:hypothetical protein